MLGGGNTGGNIANDNNQSSNNNDDLSQVSNDMDENRSNIYAKTEVPEDKNKADIDA